MRAIHESLNLCDKENQAFNDQINSQSQRKNQLMPNHTKITDHRKTGQLQVDRRRITKKLPTSNNVDIPIEKLLKPQADTAASQDTGSTCHDSNFSNVVLDKRTVNTIFDGWIADQLKITSSYAFTIICQYLSEHNLIKLQALSRTSIALRYRGAVRRYSISSRQIIQDFTCLTRTT